MTEHTPGPWIINPSDPHPVNGYRIMSERFGRLAYVARWTAYQEEGAANARLIAAAPDLLEALTAIRESFKTGGGMFKAQELAEKALAKAEGR